MLKYSVNIYAAEQFAALTAGGRQARGGEGRVAGTAQRGAGCHGKIATSEPGLAQKGPSRLQYYYQLQ